MTSVAQLADGVKFSTLGLTFGIAAGGLTEFVANEVIEALGIHKEGHAGSTPELFAEVLVRGAVGSVGYLFASQLFSRLGVQGRSDPTDGSYFIYGFGTAQTGLYAATVRLSHTVSSGNWMGIKGADASCCSDCAASGGSCGGK